MLHKEIERLRCGGGGKGATKKKTEADETNRDVPRTDLFLSEEMALRREKLPLAVLLESFADQCSTDQQEEQRRVLEMRKHEPLIEIRNLLAELEVQQTSPTGLQLASFEAVPVEPKEDVDEIDLPDVNNVLSGVQYIKELYGFYNEQQHVRRPIDYMCRQIGMTAGTRENLVYFLMTVHDELNLQPETLYLAVSIVDRFLSLHNVPFYKLHIVGLSSLFIATKYEEDWVPKAYRFLTVSGGEYSKVDVFYWERVILDALEWYLTVPTVYIFLIQYVKAAKADEELKNMIYCYGKLGLTQYSLVLFCPSMVAAATVYAARCTLERYPCWTDTLQRHTSYSASQLEWRIQPFLRDIKGMAVISKRYMYKQFSAMKTYCLAAFGRVQSGSRQEPVKLAES